MSANTGVFDTDLNPVLDKAKNSDLDIVVDYLKKKMSEDLTKTDAYKAYYPNNSKYADLIAKEIRDMGGNSFVNIFRGEGPSYHEIVRDVASKLHASYHRNDDIVTIEDSILETILTKALNKMSEAERQELMNSCSSIFDRNKGKIAAKVTVSVLKSILKRNSYQLSVIVANQVSISLLGKGLSFAATQTLTKSLSILAGPVGLVINGVWTAIDLSGPAYSVTIPIVIQVAMMRKKNNISWLSKICNFFG